MKFLKVRDVKTPERGTPSSAGIDFFIPNDSPEIRLRPGMTAWIPSGLKAKIPAGYAFIAFNKSGIAKKKKLLVGACVVDEDYQGEMHIDLKNIGKETQVLKPGDKITQFLLVPVKYSEIEIVETLEELYGGIVTDRGEGRTGSTGID